MTNPPAVLFAVATLFILLVLLHYSTVISKLTDENVELAQRIALLEGAEACRSMATGMAAMTAVLLCQLQTGDHMVGGRAAFGSCRWLTDTLLPKFGIGTTVVDARDPQAFLDAVRPEDRAAVERGVEAIADRLAQLIAEAAESAGASQAAESRR